MIELCFQSGGLNINMLCSKLENSSLFLLSSSHIKSFKKIMEVSDCIQVIIVNQKKGKEMIQFSSKYIQAVLHMLSSAQIAAFKKSERNHKLKSAVTITCVPV